MKATKKWFVSTLLRGLSIVVPFAVALQVMSWLLRNAETMTMTLAVDVFPWQIYVPGMGVLLLVAIVFGVGLLMYPWFSEKCDALFRSVPLFGSVYAPVRDLMSLLGGNAEQKLGSPVMVTIPGTEIESLAFVTRREGGNLPDGFLREGYVVAYLQFSSQIGGLSFIVPESACRPVDMSVEDAMRFSLTAGLSAPRETSNAAPVVMPAAEPPTEIRGPNEERRPTAEQSTAGQPNQEPRE